MECDSSDDCPNRNTLILCHQRARHIQPHIYIPGMLPPNRGSVQSIFRMDKGVRF